MNWFFAPLDELALIAVSSVIVYMAIIVLVRLRGLRSFTKMSSYDFVISIATGTIAGSTLLNVTSVPVMYGFTGLATIFMLDYLVARLRNNFDSFKTVTDNEPVMLMDGPEILQENLDKTQVTLDELYGKLREANVLNHGQVQAVVLEATGDISVLHTDSDETFDRALLRGVTGNQAG